MKLRSRRSSLAVPGAIFLSLMLAGQALGAHSWNPRVALTATDESFASDLAGVNDTTAVAAVVEWNGSWYDVNLYRTTTSGATWHAPITLSTNGYDVHVSAVAPFVDAVWRENGRVRYARSTDNGQTFGSSMPLSNSTFPINLSVARGPGGLVVVAWQNGSTNRIRARVSTDGGLTFGPTAAFNAHIQDMGTSVAAGSGVAYVAYKTRYYRLVVRESTDGGVTWSDPLVITTDAYGVYDQFDITAAGSRAYVAYTDKHHDQPAWGTVRYRRTLDGGMTWSSERALAPATWLTESPEIALQDGVLRAAFDRRDGFDIYFRKSTNGLSWDAAERVDGRGHEPYVTKAGSVIVLFTVGTGDAYVRVGT